MFAARCAAAPRHSRARLLHAEGGDIRMGADIVQADYEGLAQIAGRFGRQAEAAQALLEQLRGGFDPLRDGAWLGTGSAAFIAEMESVIFPVTERLIKAFFVNDTATTE